MKSVCTQEAVERLGIMLKVKRMIESAACNDGCKDSVEYTLVLLSKPFGNSNCKPAYKEDDFVEKEFLYSGAPALSSVYFC